MIKHFLQISDYTHDDLWNILQLAKELKTKFYNKEHYTPFKMQSLAMIFAKPSARTRVSFETGFNWMGGNAIYLGPKDIGIGKRESNKDLARLFSRYNNMILARLFDHDHITEIAQYSSIPVINGLTDYNHPCQIMADIFTLWEHRGNIDELKITYLGDGNNIVHSWLQLASLFPIQFVCCSPLGFEPDDKTIRMVTDSGVSTFEISHDPKSAVKDADVIYTDVWASMGQKDEEVSRASIFSNYQVNSSLLTTAKKDFLFMHCLPAERGKEVTDEVIESSNSIVFDQAENRMHVQNAIMVFLSKNL
mgnify:FL=1|tara:strand:+ start:53723 stop:54640 length:918 start_codon:yes stop_codon:yes gene_type:complete